MQFIDFIKSNNRKILIDNNLSDGNSIIKSFSLSNKISISNYEIFNINLLSKAILSTQPECKYINNEEATYLFYSFLSNKKDGSDIYNLIPDSSFSFESAKVCLSTINEIRKGKRKEGIKNENIDDLINDYEQYLLSNSYYDDVLMLKKCIEIMNGDLIKNILKLKSKYIIGIVDSYLDTLSYLERNFLETLVNKLNTSYETLTLFTENKNLAINSYKTYGFYQEVENVINIINQNKLSVSDVEIIVSDNKYSNTLKAYFDNYKIPYIFTNGVPIKCFDLFGFIDSILDFFINHYSITYLYDIYCSIALKNEYKNINKLEKLHADKNDILFHSNNSYEFNDNQKSFIQELLKLNEYSNVYEIYLNLLDLINKYCIKDFVNPLIDILNNKLNIFELCSKVNINDKPFELIRRVFEDVKVQVKPLDRSYISITPLSNVNYLNKKHIFLLGLSSSQMKLKEVESPLLSDEDIRNLIDTENYYVNLPSLNNIRFNDKLDRLIKLNNSNTIYLSYSEYDSSDFKCLSSSTFYNKFTIKEDSPLINDKLHLNMMEITDKVDEKIIDNESFNRIKEEKSITPSSLDELYKCPLKYIYEQHYYNIALNEYDGNWLGYNESGNLAHKILEIYYKKHVNKDYDESSFNEIFNEVSNKFIIEHPFDNLDEINRELKNVKRVVNRYIKSVKDKNDSYKVLGCEIRFKELDVQLNNKPYKFRGSVDRADYYLDETSNELHIRIYDYKTGKELSLDNDGLTQSFIYTKAIEDYVKKPEVKDKLGNFDINKIKCEFHYVFLFIDLDKVVEDINVTKAANEEKLRKFDRLENSYSSFVSVYNPSLKKEPKNPIGIKCVYCNYRDKCLIKRHNSLNTMWESKKDED